MSNSLLSVISCLCLLHNVISADDCKDVLAEGKTFYAPARSSLSLSCQVKHCGKNWTGNWMWINSESAESIVNESVRHHLSKVSLSSNETEFILHFLSVNRSDEGSYGCDITWSDGNTKGNRMYVNVTAALRYQRTALHRLLVCAGASLCLPIILGLARCLSSEVKPQPLPRRLSADADVHIDLPELVPQPPPRCPVPQKHRKVPQKAAPKSQQKTEVSEHPVCQDRMAPAAASALVVYADISQSALRQPGDVREPAHSTVYSALRFS